MRLTIQTLLLYCFTLPLFAGQTSAQQASPNSKSTLQVIQPGSSTFNIGTINNIFLPTGSENYLISSTANDMQNHTYILSTDSNKTVAYIMINGIKERLVFQANGEHVPVYVNDKYTIVINMTPAKANTSTDVQKIGAKEDWGYSAFEGRITVSDMKGNVTAKSFIGAKVSEVKK